MQKFGVWFMLGSLTWEEAPSFLLNRYSSLASFFKCRQKTILSSNHRIFKVIMCENG